MTSTIHGRFRARARAYPDAPAITGSGATISYRRLDTDSDRIAAGLHADGVRAGDRVGVLAGRGPQLPALLLGVLKAGAAYAVLDPAWPLARREQARELLGGPLVTVDPARTAQDRPVPPDTVTGTDPAQIFFTSGSTGRPKAAITPHAAMTRLLDDPEFASFGPHTVMPLGAPAAWDAFALELWGPLLAGGTAVVLDAPTLDPGALRAGIREHGVNTAWLGAALFNVIVDEDPGAFAGLHRLFTGGERLSTGHVRRFLREHPAIRLINGYGPVECTVFVAVHPVTPDDCEHPDGIPLGRAVAGTDLVLLEPDRPAGPPGDLREICVGGPRVGLGYLGDPDATAQRFVRYRGRPLYRTGDLGRRTPDGLLRFAGRADRQLKIRGFRIAPEEIETAVAGLPGVARCAVGAVRDRLVAWYTTRDGVPLDLRADLADRLPAHLLPDEVRHLAALPLLSNGKLDHPALAGDRGDRPDPVVASASPADHTVREILGDRTPSWTTPFGHAGVTSLELIRIGTRLGQRLGRPVPLALLTASVTRADLARHLSVAGAARPGGPRTGPAPLLPMQVGMLLAGELSGGSAAHCALGWMLTGEVDIDALTGAYGDLLARHEALRCAYVFTDPPRAEPLPRPPAPDVRRLNPVGAEAAAVAAVTSALMEPLDPGTGQVSRFVVCPVAAPRGVFAGLVVHHVTWDASSERQAVAELSAHYRRRGDRGPAPELPDAPGVAEVALRCVDRLASARPAGQRAFWRTALAGLPPFPGPPDTDEQAPPDVAVIVEESVPSAAVRAADDLAARVGGTRFAVLLTVFAQAVARATGAADFVVGVPIDKRADPLLERALGCLIDVLCVRLRPDPGAAPLAAVTATATALNAAMAARDVALGEVVRLAGLTGGPPYRVMFTVQPHDVPLLELPGVRARGYRVDPPESMTDLGAALWPTPEGGYLARVTFRPGRISPDAAEAIGRALSRAVPAGPRVPR
ncbi:AMP-binding protein [Actinoplanes sp. L3-i22]|uniref:AMP-binding protein n=1 Tax=Actinoplanes sp. L3-i22 TaxID=2836373 RepID=UPI001C75E0C3|nr:AMP-binding protein [Actinoplanes sp. L3-i22]BCY09067.1 amino acid adenylation protein [Actinoplanes sp. L3-i22]